MTEHHIEQAEALRALAAFVEANPQYTDDFRYAFNHINVYVKGDKKAALADMVRAGLRAGAKVEKKVYGAWFSAELDFGGGVDLQVNANRDEVCERVVTGTKTVTKLVPDPAIEVPEVEITEEVEIYEYVCGPLMSVSNPAGAA
jgi:hypothetical protein